MRRLVIVFVVFVVVVAAAALLLPGVSSLAPERIWVPRALGLGEEPWREPGGEHVSGLVCTGGASGAGLMRSGIFTRRATWVDRVLGFFGVPAGRRDFVYLSTGRTRDSETNGERWQELARCDD